MKDPIENALERMKPAEMSAPLMARLTAARPQPVEPRQHGSLGQLLRRWLLPLAAGGCAAAVTIIVLRDTGGGGDAGPAVAAAEPIPMEQEDYLLGARDVGVVVAPNQRPYRMVEVEWMEQDTIRSKRGGPGVRVETKRREVIPVALDIY